MRTISGTIEEICEELEKEGFFWIKDHQRWGKCPTFKNFETGDILFLDMGTLLNPVEMLEDLEQNWRPPDADDWNAAMGDMRRIVNVWKKRQEGVEA